MQSAGLKWNFYQANLLDANDKITAASIELSAFSNKTNEFGLTVSEIYLPNLTIFFRDPTTFSVANMEDEGWKAKLLYTWSMDSLGVATIWTGYGESSATSATTSTITSQTIRSYFEQTFDTNEEYLYLGASMTMDITPRLPVTLSYEYISITGSEFTREPLIPPSSLPGFITQTNQSGVDNNHTVQARISYWLTPALNLSLSANFYSNQYLGVIPHYNNPLSGSFTDKPYGFAGLQMGFRF